MATNKAVILTIQQRLDVLKDLETFSVASVAKKYNVHQGTIRRILKKAPEIMKFADKNKKDRRRQRIKKPMYEELEQQLLVWFAQRRAMGDIISDALFLEKAAELKECMAIRSFKVSAGWLAKFKRRHEIRLVHIYGEKGSADKNAADEFVNNFKKHLDDENIDLDDVYNMDESGLLWKALPVKTLAYKSEVSVSGQKIRKERITVGFCANITGTHKMVPIVINKYKKPRALKNNMDQLPVIFKAQRNAWMDRALFIDWYENHFKKEVRTFQLQRGTCGKALLLLDNCSSHRFPPNYTHDDNFKIIYLPPNTTALIQPMDQGIIQKTKTYFRHKLTQHVIRTEKGIQDFYKSYTIKNCIQIIKEAWDKVTPNNIKNSWNKIIAPDHIETEIAAEADDIISEMQHTCSQFSDLNITKEDILEYITTCTAEENTFSKEAEEAVVEAGNQNEDDRMETEENERTNEERGEENTGEKDGGEGVSFPGLPLTDEKRKKIMEGFKYLEEFKDEYPLPIQWHLRGLKLSILGNMQE